ncbi:MAG: 1-acyl-sn-glycerol-3-phosphate acyltransferase [Rhodospirillales bacterium]|nr:1-acyl-sn-glycerol-3-phosphate acyltransferase [Rhodospirillales bacterium]MBO6785278.1 1-acyl-sn-glycerol-3-phosphate acyltransferase [Rhodospirillales bacterium]
MYQNYREIPSPLQTIWDILDDYAATKTSIVRAGLRAAGFLAVTGTLVGPYALAGLAMPAAKRPIAKLWFRVCQKICGLRVRVKGLPHTAGATLIAANHVSYLDIIVLGALVDARFVAKKDVAGWPLFGLLARLANTIFVSRERRNAANDGGELRGALACGEKIILFPEGTSSNGLNVLPFKSALFSAVEPKHVDPGVVMQPVSVAYARYADGRKLKGDLTDLYAWYGDMTLAGHLLSVFGLKGCVVEVNFMPPIRPVAFPDRKSLAQACERAVRQSLISAHRGY